MVERNGTYEVFKIKDYKDIESIVRLKDKKKTFVISKNKPAYIFQNKWIYFVDYDKADSYSFITVKSHLDSKTLDALWSQQFILNLILRSDREEQKQIEWFSLIIGLIIGALVSAIVVMILMQSRIDELYDIIDNSDNPIYPSIINLCSVARILI